VCNGCEQGCELGRHWQRHSVQDADGCYSCAACSFTSNVRLIMHSHAHVHFVRRRSTTFQPTSALRCRLCAKPRRRAVSTNRGCILPVPKRAEDGALAMSLWCSECCRRMATSRLLKLRHGSSCPVKSVCRPLGHREVAVCNTTGGRVENSEACQSCA